MRALCYLRENISNKTSLINQLNVYLGLVLLIIPYESKVWHSNKRDLVLLEKLQKNGSLELQKQAFNSEYSTSCDVLGTPQSLTLL